MGMPGLFWNFAADIKPLLANVAAGEIHEWKCPCDEPDCKGFVLYCRDKDGGVSFTATQTFDPVGAPLVFHIDNAEDFEAFLADENAPAFDRMMYAMWLMIGLKEALLGAT